MADSEKIGKERVEASRPLPSRSHLEELGLSKPVPEQVQRRLEEHLKGIFENTAIGVYRTTPDGSILVANPALVHMLGYSSFGQLSRRNLEEEGYEPEYPRSAFKERIERDGQVVGLESSWVRRDGTTTVVIENARKVCDEFGNTLYYEGTAEDITQRKRAEEELRRARDDYLTVTNLTGDIITRVDKEGRWTFLNDGACKFWGKPREKLLGTKFAEYLHPDDVVKTHAAVREMVGAKSIVKGVTNRQKTPNGWRIVQWNSAAIFDEVGNYAGLQATGRDITKHKQAEEALQRAYDELGARVEERTAELAKANEELHDEIAERERLEKTLRESDKLVTAGQMAARIAHEIGNPLAGIKNSFQLIEDAIPKDHPYYEYVGRIDKEISRVTHIVRQMFDLYRPGQESPGEFCLRDAIGDIVALLGLSTKERNVNIEVDIDDDSTMVILTELLFRQILYNIIQNAIQASPPGETVKVSATVSNERLILKVSDRGSGIGEDIRDRIFEPFFTSGSGGPTSGLGLGLSICRDIVDAMEGSISYESKTGGGTTFSVVIPLTDESKELKYG